MEKQKLIETLDDIINTGSSSLSEEDRRKLQEVKEALKKAKSKEEIINALKPLAYLFQLIKALTEILF